MNVMSSSIFSCIHLWWNVVPQKTFSMSLFSILLKNIFLKLISREGEPHIYYYNKTIFIIIAFNIFQLTERALLNVNGCNW